jgi:hypothetical protein
MTFTMQAIADRLERTIRAQRPLDLTVTWADEIIFPSYDGLSLTNVPHTVAHQLGAPLPASVPLRDDIWGPTAPDVQRVVVFLLDGLGYQHLLQLIDADDDIRQAVQDISGGRGALPLTSIAPSTTAVALPALWTGGTPAQTGMIGTAMFLRELHAIFNMLAFNPALPDMPIDAIYDWGMTVDDVVHRAGLATHLAQHGIPTYMLTNKYFIGSGLSSVLHRGIPRDHMYTHIAATDFDLQAHHILRDTQGDRCHVSLYWSGMDSLAHKYGTHSAYTHEDVKRRLLALRDILQRDDVRDGQTLFMLMADHGHYDVSQTIDLATDAPAQVIRDAMTFAATGDNRLPILHLRPDTVDDVRDALQTHYSDHIAVVDSHSAYTGGLHGVGDDFAPVTRARMGDLILIPRRGVLVTGRVPRPQMISWHGGLSDWEMIIPLLWHTL